MLSLAVPHNSISVVLFISKKAVSSPDGRRVSTVASELIPMPFDAFLDQRIHFLSGFERVLAEPEDGSEESWRSCSQAGGSGSLGRPLLWMASVVMFVFKNIEFLMSSLDCRLDIPSDVTNFVFLCLGRLVGREKALAS